jgi:hypothetical protein
MKATNPWITYRTRFLVQAKQLTTSLSFTDALGRQHSGRKGDYLVESSDGVLRIAPRQIFEDIYVPLAEAEVLVDPPTSATHDAAWRPDSGSNRGPARKTSTVLPSHLVPPHLVPPHLVRKSPQSDRGRRSPISGLGSV